MTNDAHYGAYLVSKEYLAHQDKYFREPRASDNIIIEMVRTFIEESGRREEDLSLLDIGCSTGHLLHHLRQKFPDLHLVGGDMFEDVILRCQGDANLKGIDFKVMNLLRLEPVQGFDIVVTNAVLYYINESDFDHSLKRIHDVLSARGCLMAFDLFHGYEQDLRVIETTADQPEGLALHIRSIPKITASLSRSGFSNVEFRPFEISIDLLNSGKPEDITSFTIPTKDSSRLIFRGALYTPWCHMTAQRTR